MASGASEVSICNLALSHIGDLTITALSDNSNQAKECNRLYAITRDMEQAAHNWNFCIKRTSLAEDGSTPSFEYGHRYQTPSECLRVIDVDGSSNWRIEAGNLADAGKTFIVCDLSGPLYIRYIERTTDPAVFSVLFVNLLAARLAVDLAPRLSQSNTVEERAVQKYQYWAGQARAMDAQESAPRGRPVSPWITSRYRGRSWLSGWWES